LLTLEFRNKVFVENKEPNGDTISLKFDEGSRKLVLNVPLGCSMVDRLTAQRQANGISKFGWLASSGARIGEGYEVILDGGGGQTPDRLNHSPRQVY